MRKYFDPEAAKDMASIEIASYLTPKEQKFAKEFLKDGNATRAAREAGYPEKNIYITAWKLVNKEKIIAYRRALIKEKFVSLDLSPENIASKYIDVYQMCVGENPSPTGAARALEGISRLMGYDAPSKHEVKVESFENAIQTIEDELDGRS